MVFVFLVRVVGGVEIEVQRKRFTLDVDFRAQYAAAVEGLAEPTGAGLDFLVGQQRVFQHAVGVLQFRIRLDEARHERRFVFDGKNGRLVRLVGRFVDRGLLDRLDDLCNGRFFHRHNRRFLCRFGGDFLYRLNGFRGGHGRFDNGLGLFLCLDRGTARGHFQYADQALFDQGLVVGVVKAVGLVLFPARFDAEFLHRLGDQPQGVFQAPLALDAHGHGRARVFGAARKVLKMILVFLVLVVGGVEIEVQRKRFTFYVDLGAQGSAAVEGLAEPTGAGLDFLIRQQRVFQRGIRPLQRLVRLHQARREGRFVFDGKDGGRTRRFRFILFCFVKPLVGHAFPLLSSKCGVLSRYQ